MGIQLQNSRPGATDIRPLDGQLYHLAPGANRRCPDIREHVAQHSALTRCRITCNHPQPPSSNNARNSPTVRFIQRNVSPISRARADLPLASARSRRSPNPPTPRAEPSLASRDAPLAHRCAATRLRRVAHVQQGYTDAVRREVTGWANLDDAVLVYGPAVFDHSSQK